ncbi:MAG TPA: alpha/beta fold hydrolase [Spirochaetota bacterium]|nr:alpha/beta fold hydrolase [Spirochaetota bacterium]
MEIMKGAEPYSFVGKKDIGLLLIHGFTGTTSSLKGIGEYFAGKGYHIELPRLSGHGTKWEDLNEVKWTDWLNDVETAFNALKKRCSNIFVVGLSMGGTLALVLAENHSDINGIVLINHACIFKDIRLFFVPILKHFMKYAEGVAGDVKNPEVKEIAYDRSPVFGVHELLRLIKVMKKNLSKITQPTLILKSKEDHVIPRESVSYVYERIQAIKKRVEWLNNSYHVATIDYDKDIIIEKIENFIKELS